MRNRVISCRKYHYSVPVTFDEADTMLKYDAATDEIKFFPLRKQSALMEKG